MLAVILKTGLGVEERKPMAKHDGGIAKFDTQIKNQQDLVCVEGYLTVLISNKKSSSIKIYLEKNRPDFLV